MTTFFAILTATYLDHGQEHREKVAFPSYQLCADAIEPVWDHLDREGATDIVVGCDDTGVLSGTIRPRARGDE